jgi:hypothetical protein
MTNKRIRQKIVKRFARTVSLRNDLIPEFIRDMNKSKNTTTLKRSLNSWFESEMEYGYNVNYL